MVEEDDEGADDHQDEGEDGGECGRFGLAAPGFGDLLVDFGDAVGEGFEWFIGGAIDLFHGGFAPVVPWQVWYSILLYCPQERRWVAPHACKSQAQLLARTLESLQEHIMITLNGVSKQCRES